MKFLIAILGIIQFCVANNKFENVICGNETLATFNEEFEEMDKLCIFNKINLTADFDDIFRKINSNMNSFIYNECKNSRCERKRNGWDTYKAISFRNSKLITLSTLETNKLNHIKSFTASNVGLNSITRDNFKSLKNLEKLDLSHNELQNLEFMLFKHAPALTSINLSNNKIDFIHAGTFENSSEKIEEINLSNNKLKSFPGNILDSVVSKSLKLHLQFNEIEEIIEPQNNKNFFLDTIDLSNNKLTNFHLACENINILWLNNNELENFSNDDCFISHLYLYDNNFSKLNVTKTFSLFISSNIRLKELAISDISELTTFDASNLSAGLITLEMLQNATNLQNLDLSGTHIGPLEIDSFADMTNLEILKLKNTGILKIDYGMLSHQKNLQHLDISFNNLGSIDLNVLIGLNKLESLDISGNNLTEIPHFDSLKKILPSLKSLGFYHNNFDCAYLATLIKYLNLNDITFNTPENITKTSNHISGIACTRAESVEKIKLIQSSSDGTSQKLNEIIEKINSYRSNMENIKVDFDLLKDQILHIQNENMNIKSKLMQNQSPREVLDTQSLTETMKNFSLELAKLKIEMDHKFDMTHVENSVQGAGALKDFKNSESSKGFTTSDLLLTMIITSLVIVSIVFMFVKIQSKFKRYLHTVNYSARARSTNTINTGIETSFDNNML